MKKEDILEKCINEIRAGKLLWKTTWLDTLVLVMSYEY
jgi:hypothetical protein